MDENAAIILGIDPGTRVTGYGVIQTDGRAHVALDYGTIRPSQNRSPHERYLQIFEGIELLITKYQPTAVAVELQFVHKNPQSAMKLGMARAVATLAASRQKIPVFEYAPKKAKLSIVGTGSASKEQVQKMIQLLLKLRELPKPEDAADALALALCHAHQQGKVYV